MVERLPGARIGLGGTKQIVERQGGQRTSSNSTEAPTFTSSAAYAAESRAEIPRGDPAIFTVVAADSRPISTAPFEHGHPVTIHETPWCPIILSGRGAEHHALAISTGDTQAIAGLPAWSGRWRAWYAPRCRRGWSPLRSPGNQPQPEWPVLWHWLPARLCSGGFPRPKRSPARRVQQPPAGRPGGCCLMQSGRLAGLSPDPSLAGRGEGCARPPGVNPGKLRASRRRRGRD